MQPAALAAENRCTPICWRGAVPATVPPPQISPRSREGHEGRRCRLWARRNNVAPVAWNPACGGDFTGDLRSPIAARAAAANFNKE
jgi:hypothetical protein